MDRQATGPAPAHDSGVDQRARCAVAAASRDDPMGRGDNGAAPQRSRLRRSHGHRPRSGSASDARRSATPRRMTPEDGSRRWRSAHRRQGGGLRTAVAIDASTCPRSHRTRTQFSLRQATWGAGIWGMCEVGSTTRPATAVWDDLGAIGARGAAVEAMLLVWALGSCCCMRTARLVGPGPGDCGA